MHVPGSLAHYPPVPATDFRTCPWGDGISPLVPAANLWIYPGTGSTYGGLIAGRVLVAPGLTLGPTSQLAHRIWGGVGARLTMAALGLSYHVAPSGQTAGWIALAAARHSWVFAWQSFMQPWPYTWNTWTGVDRYIAHSRQSSIWPRLVTAAEGRGIIVDSPNYFVLGLRSGGAMIPLFSPEAAALTVTPPGKNLSDIVAALRRQEIRFVILTDDNMHNRQFLPSRPGLRLLFNSPPTLETEGMKIYDLYLPISSPVQTSR